MVPLLGRASHLRCSLGEHHTSWLLAQETYELATRAESDELLLEAYILLGLSNYFLGRFELALSNLSKVLAIYDFDRHSHQIYLYGQDQGVHAGLYTAHSLWQLGFPDQAYAQMQSTVALAERTQHSNTIAFAQSFAALMYSFANDVPRTLEHSAIAITICEQYGFPQYLSLALGLHGVALARMGNFEVGGPELEQARALAKQVDILAMLPYMLGLTAECLQRIGQLDAALGLVETARQAAQQTGETFHEATLRRLRGELFLDRGEPWLVAKAEMESALDVARQYRARSLELQIAISYYRLALQHGTPDDQATARQLLEELYSAFTEGASTPDLQTASALLG
jgi:predicted ATPase